MISNEIDNADLIVNDIVQCTSRPGQAANGKVQRLKVTNVNVSSFFSYRTLSLLLTFLHWIVKHISIDVKMLAIECSKISRYTYHTYNTYLREVNRKRNLYL